MQGLLWLDARIVRMSNCMTNVTESKVGVVIDYISVKEVAGKRGIAQLK